METDEQILKQKALDSIANYGVDVVVANELHSRRYKVTLYHKNAETVVLEMGADDKRDIEELLIEKIYAYFQKEQELRNKLV